MAGISGKTQKALQTQRVPYLLNISQHMHSAWSWECIGYTHSPASPVVSGTARSFQQGHGAGKQQGQEYWELWKERL